MGKTGLPEAEAFLFAHMSGDGDLVHVCSADGETSHFLTGGADCVAHLRSPATLAAAGEAAGVGHHDAGVTALAAPRSGARFATGCEDGQVRVFSYPGGELAAIATRFTLPVRALAFSNDGALLAAGGDEDTIRLLDVSGEEPALRHTLQGTFRAVRSLAFDAKVRARAKQAVRERVFAKTLLGGSSPASRALRSGRVSHRITATDGSLRQGELLVSCHEDGAVLVWDVAAGEVRHDLGKLAPSVARADWHAYNRCAWAPDGSRLAVPGRNNDVVLLSRDDDFAEVARLKDVHLGDVSVLAMSPNGLYCATAGMDLQVVVWELRKCVAVATSKLPEPATGLAWRTGADANALAVLTREGTAALWEAPVSARLPPPAKALEDVDMSDFEAPTAGGFVDDSAVDATGDGDGVDGEDDADGESSGGDGSDSAGGEDGAGKGRERRERIVMMPAPPAPQAQPQGAIAPGATPAMGAPPRRFLAYNTLGCVTCRDDGPVQHIETHFHDLERPGPRVPSHTDYLGVNLGALGPAGVACASPEKVRSKILCGKCDALC
jgi:chromosome transmission fidelity protein 4